MQATYVFSHTPHTFHRADERTHLQFTRYLVSPTIPPVDLRTSDLPAEPQLRPELLHQRMLHQ